MTTAKTNRQIILTSRPKGMPDLSHFALHTVALPAPKEGEVVVRSLYLTVDPYMRGRMKEGRSYIDPWEINQPPTGGVVGEVVESQSPSFKVGDIVLGFLPWADYSAAPAGELHKLDPKQAPISTALGVLGMPGMTAYFGLSDIGQPKAGETVVVSAAAGAVGSAVGQIAKIKGCRVVGIAGGKEKVAYLTKELGFDAAIDYKQPNLADELRKACPKGVDVYFDNVGGEITDEVLRLINRHARIVICGQISMYNLEKPDIGPRNFWLLLVRSALAKGFIVDEYKARFPEGTKQMAEWLKQGKLKYKESVVQGLENTPKAFLGLFKGENIGKQLVKV